MDIKEFDKMKVEQGFPRFTIGDLVVYVQVIKTFSCSDKEEERRRWEREQEKHKQFYGSIGKVVAVSNNGERSYAIDELEGKLPFHAWFRDAALERAPESKYLEYYFNKK